ncbi:MAG: metal-dependent transcriptional regulator [Gemmatimonadales bacterium]|nr:metal-dependent transcriptional regulator [Gemmatimonadales bacterium]
MHAAAPDVLTRSAEDYLKAIFRLTAEGRHASTSDIAHLLDLSAPSVSAMIKRLSDQGLLEHVPYKGVQLTGEGRRVALRVVRRHRLIETYLVGCLNYTWDTVHDEAERLEHAASDTLVERMAAVLGHPAVDPHGDPIPTADGAIAEPAETPLSAVEVGHTVSVGRVAEGEPERLRYIASVGLRPGVVVTVVTRQPFQGPITVHADGGDHVIGHDLAQTIYCVRAHPSRGADANREAGR